MKRIDFKIREGESFIPLIQLLKATNVVSSGSEAQQVVVDGLVLRNGKIEFRKRAKILNDDIVVFQNFEIVVHNA